MKLLRILLITIFFLNNIYGSKEEGNDEKVMDVELIFQKIDFLNIMGRIGFSIDKENLKTNIEKYVRNKELNFSYSESEYQEDLNNLIPLIAPINLDFNKIKNELIYQELEEKQSKKEKYYKNILSIYNDISSHYLGKIATDKRFINAIPEFIQSIGNAEHGTEKLENLVLYFIDAQIQQYRKLAIAKFKKGNLSSPSVKYLVEEFVNDFLSKSSPALIAAQKLYKIKPDSFNNDYLNKIREICQLITDTYDVYEGQSRPGFNLDDNRLGGIYFSEPFLNAVKENKAQYIWRHYSWHIIFGSGLLGLLIVGKKYQWYVLFQQFLEKYRNK